MSARNRTATNGPKMVPSAREASKLYKRLREGDRTAQAPRPRRVPKPLEGQLDILGNEATVDDGAHPWRDKVGGDGW